MFGLGLLAREDGRMVGLDCHTDAMWVSGDRRTVLHPSMCFIRCFNPLPAPGTCASRARLTDADFNNDQLSAHVYCKKDLLPHILAFRVFAQHSMQLGGGCGSCGHKRRWMYLHVGEPSNPETNIMMLAATLYQ